MKKYIHIYRTDNYFNDVLLKNYILNGSSHIQLRIYVNLSTYVRLIGTSELQTMIMKLIMIPDYKNGEI